MTWVAVDDQFFRNPKARAAGKDGRALYLAGLCYCGANLTDGRIPVSMLALLCAEAEVEPGTADVLVECSLWLSDGSEYVCPDYLQWNSSRADVEAKKAANRERGKRHRERKTNGVANALRAPLLTPPETPHTTDSYLVGTKETQEGAPQPVDNARGLALVKDALKGAS